MNIKNNKVIELSDEQLENITAGVGKMSITQTCSDYKTKNSCLMNVNCAWSAFGKCYSIKL